MIGLAGAHRTGKTTLAKAFAKEYDIPFVETNAKEVFEKMGFDPKLDYPLADRLAIQLEILRAFSKRWAEYGTREFISDRTPLDLAAYMLADVQRQTVEPALGFHIAQYVEDCIRETNRHFATILVVQPGIKLKDEPGKAPAHHAYVEHISQLIMGLANDERVEAYQFYIPRKMTSMELRMECLRVAVEKSRLRWDAEKQAAPLQFLFH